MSGQLNFYASAINISTDHIISSKYGRLVMGRRKMARAGALEDQVEGSQADFERNLREPLWHLGSLRIRMLIKHARVLHSDNDDDRE